MYVLFFIELGSRRVHVAGLTSTPDSAWVTQQARNLVMEDRLKGARFLRHDRDAKFCGPFEEVVRSEGVKIIKTPTRAPKANAVAERWVRTVRNECLDHVLVVGRRHLEGVLSGLRGPLQRRAAAPLAGTRPSGRSTGDQALPTPLGGPSPRSTRRGDP